MIASKYNTSKQNTLSHFINDVKYVTVSLKKDRHKLFSDYREEILEADITSMKERFAAKYLPIVSQMKQELHNEVSCKKGIRSRELLSNHQHRIEHLLLRLSQFLELKIPSLIAYQQDQERCLLDYYELKHSLESSELKVQPTPLWFQSEKYEEIRSWIDAIQTRIEDLIHAKKRIHKVWKEEILDDKYDEMIHSYQKAKSGNFRYLNANFWKVRKQVRKLFIEDLSLLTEAEFELLNHNRTILKQNTQWLIQHETMIKTILGEAYQGIDTLFEQIRKQYEGFYQILIKFEMVSCKEVLELLQQCFLQEELFQIEHLHLEHLYEMCEERKRVLSELRKDYEFISSHSLEKRDALELEEIRNVIYLIERIQSKTVWLKEKEEEIKKVFGQARLSKQTNWQQYQKKVLPIEQIPELEDFVPFEPMNPLQYTLEELFYQMLEKEQPVHQLRLQKRLAFLTNTPRITSSFKKACQQLFMNLRPEYECVGEFIESVDKSLIVFRKSLTAKRDIADVSETELKVGILSIIQAKDEVTLDDITKAIAKLLGYPRRNQTLNLRVQEAVKGLRREGRIERFSGGWRKISQ